MSTESLTDVLATISVTWPRVWLALTVLASTGFALVRLHWHLNSQLRNEISDLERRLNRTQNDLQRTQHELTESEKISNQLSASAKVREEKIASLKHAVAGLKDENDKLRSNKPATDRSEELDELSANVIMAIGEGSLEALIRAKTINRQSLQFRIDGLERRRFVGSGPDGYFVLPEGRQWLYDHEYLR